MRNFIERLRSKPEHVRHRVALGSAAGVTAVVTLTWLSALTLSGNLALTVPTFTGDSSTADSATLTPDLSQQVRQTQSGFAQLLGAAGIATATTAPAALVVEDVKPTTTPAVQKNAVGQTVIPF